MTRIKIQEKESTFVGMIAFDNYDFIPHKAPSSWKKTVSLRINTTGLNSIDIYANDSISDKTGVNALIQAQEFIYEQIASGKGIIDFTPVYKAIAELPNEVVDISHNVWNSRPSKQMYRYTIVKGHNDLRGNYEELMKLEYPIKIKSHGRGQQNNVLSMYYGVKLSGQTDWSVTFGFTVDVKSFEGSTDDFLDTMRKRTRQVLNEMYAKKMVVDVHKIILEQMATVKYQSGKQSTANWWG